MNEPKPTEPTGTAVRSSELLACPWCGVMPEIRQPVKPGRWEVACMNYKCPTYWQTSGATMEDAISKANARQANEKGQP